MFEPYQSDEDGGTWSASCRNPECEWGQDCAWTPYGDGADLATLALSAAEHQRNPGAIALEAQFRTRSGQRPDPHRWTRAAARA